MSNLYFFPSNGDKDLCTAALEYGKRFERESFERKNVAACLQTVLSYRL